MNIKNSQPITIFITNGLAVGILCTLNKFFIAL